MTTPELPEAPAQQHLPAPSATTDMAQPPLFGHPVVAKRSNTVGLIALIFGILGFVFACITGALIVGWVLLPVAFILAIVSFFAKGKSKWMGVLALILSIVGTIVGAIVFTAVVAESVSSAFGSSHTTVTEPGKVAAAPAAKPDAKSGTRDKPYALGSVIKSDDWRVVVNSVDLAATAAVLADNQFNKSPAEGTGFILVNYTVTYIGDDPDGGIPAFVTIDYVTPAGVTVNKLDNFVSAPDAIDSLSALFTNGAATGNLAIAVPTASAGQGVLAVSPGMLSDKVFVAVK